jgi:hypothetical protein
MRANGSECGDFFKIFLCVLGSKAMAMIEEWIKEIKCEEKNEEKN